MDIGSWGNPFGDANATPNANTVVLVTSGVSTSEHRLANSGALPVMGGATTAPDAGLGWGQPIPGHSGDVEFAGTGSLQMSSQRRNAGSHHDLPRAHKRPRGAHKGPRRAALTGDGFRRMGPKFPPFARIRSIKFSRLDNDTITRMSVVDVTQSMVYDRDRPRPGGVNDALMGPIDRRIRCGTCHYGPGVCDGHPGRIPLPIPVYDEGCLRDLLRICRTLCIFCCRTVVVMDDPRVRTSVQSLSPDLNPRERVIAMTAIGKLKKLCPRCKMPRPVVKRLKRTIGIQFQFKPSQMTSIQGSPAAHAWAEGPWTPACVLSVLKAVPDEDWQLLGFPKPDDGCLDYSPVRMILSSHVCPPTSIRYAISVAENSKMRGQDDLTGIAQLITKSSNTIRRLITKRHEREVMCSEALRQDVALVAGPVPCTKATIAVAPPGASQDDKKRAKAYTESSKSMHSLAWRTVTGAESTVLAAHMASRQHTEKMRAVTAGERGAPSGAAATAAVAAAAASASTATIVAEKTALVVSTAEELVDEVLARARPQGVVAAKVYVTGGVSLSRWLHAAHPREVDALQASVAAFKRNDGRAAQQAKQRSGKVMRGMAKRLKGKQGRFRGHLQGKRCDQNARSVITPDPGLAPDELGVPYRIMRRLTIREAVTDLNADRLQAAVMKGPNVDGGATRVMRGDGTVVHLRYHRERHLLRLKVGWIVMRHMMDGDIALFNRQPSLQKTNIMGFKVIGVPGDTLRMNVSATTPFNADFDGDEMNIHIVQSEMAEAEARTLMHARWNLTMAQTNGPTMGVVQEALLGAHLITRDGTWLSREEMGALVSSLRHPVGVAALRRLPPPADVDSKGPRWTGKQAFSLVLPPQLFVTRIVRNIAGNGGNDEERMRDSEEIIQIVAGELVEGVLGKTMLGPKRGSLVHRIRQDIGDVAAMNFLTDAQNLVRAWMHTQGFSVGLTDFMMDPQSERAIRRDVTAGTVAIDQVSQRLSEIQRALRGAPGGVAMAESRLEELIDKTQARVTHAVMAQMRKRIQEARHGTEVRFGDAVATEHPWGNRLMQMVWAESKGGVANLSQILGCVGQQNVHSQRVTLNQNADRTLPHYGHGCRNIASRGLCARSYFRGLNPIEQYMHAMSGREGLVNTAVTTSETGYMSRKIRAMLEHITANHAGALVDDRGVCVQPSYGGDGMDPCEIEHVPVRVLTVANDRVRATCDHYEPMASHLITLRDLVRASRGNVLTPLFSDTMLLPVRVPSIIAMVVGCGGGSSSSSPTSCTALPDEPSADVHFIHEEAKRLCDNLSRAIGHDETLALRLHVMWELAPRNFEASVAKALGQAAVRIRRGDVVRVCSSILKACKSACVEGGTACGVVAAGSAGAPSTQMSLDSFHHTGQRHVTLQTGVPRMRELVEATVDIRTPSMIAPIRESALPERARPGATAEEVRAAESARRKAANRYARLLRSLTLREVVAEDLIVHDPPARPGETITSVEQDVPWMLETERIFGRETDVCDDLSHWIIRLKLDRPLLRERGGTPALMARAVQRMCAVCKIQCVITFSDATQHPWVVRVRPVGERYATEGDMRLLKSQIVSKAVANGMLGLKIANAIERHVHVVDPCTGAMVKQSEWVIQTQGSTLGDLTRVPFIDWRRATTNDVHQVLKTLGIEAARGVQHHELHTLLNAGSSVDARHTGLIADAQTMRGFMLAATRHGINRIDTGVLQRASFEEMMDMIEDAATYGEVDHLRGVSENICVGQVTPVGTGTVAIQRDVIHVSHGPQSKDLHKLRTKDPFPMNIDTRTGLEVTRSKARHMPLHARATRFEAEMARRKACVFSEEAREEDSAIITRIPLCDAPQTHARAASQRGLRAVVGTQPRAGLALRNEESGLGPVFEIRFDAASWTDPRWDVDVHVRGCEALMPLDTTNRIIAGAGDDVLQQQSTVRETTRVMLNPGAPVPGGPVNSVHTDALSALLEQVRNSIAESIDYGPTRHHNNQQQQQQQQPERPTTQARQHHTHQILRNVRVELANTTGVSYEEWTYNRVHAQQHDSCTTNDAEAHDNGATLPLGSDVTAAPRSWTPAMHSSSSRVDPWKGGPVRNARGVIIHAGGVRVANDTNRAPHLAADTSLLRPGSSFDAGNATLGLQRVSECARAAIAFVPDS